MIRYLKKKLYRWVDQQFLDGCSSYNSLEVRRACRTKEQAREKFREHGIPFAEGKIWVWPWSASAFVKKHGYPVVIKPNLGGYSRGSYFPITNQRELMKAMLGVKKWWPRSVIEQYLRGKNYRVVVTREGVQIVVRRFPPFVVGDGLKTISELIDEENQIRRNMKLLPIIHEIEKSSLVLRHLKKKDMTLETIPADGQEVELFHRVALSPGGVLETIDMGIVPQKNMELFEKVLRIFDANILGIDVIMEEGVDIPFDEQKTIFLEVNSRPYLKMHACPRWGKVPDMDFLYKKLDQLEVEDRDIY